MDDKELTSQLKHKRLPKTKEGLLRAAEELREKAKALEERANAIEGILKTPEGISWEGPLKTFSMRIPATLYAYLDTASKGLGITMVGFVRGITDIGIAEVHSRLPIELQEELDRIRKTNE